MHNSSGYTVRPELLRYSGDELRQLAGERSRASAESFERSDTDGFLSQWALDSTAALYRHAAELADDGWFADFPALFTSGGELLPDARLVQTRYGSAWVTGDGDSAVWFNPSRAADPATAERNNARKGYRVGTVRRRAVPVLVSGGALSCYPSHVPDRDFAAVA